MKETMSLLRHSPKRGKDIRGGADEHLRSQSVVMLINCATVTNLEDAVDDGLRFSDDSQPSGSRPDKRGGEAVVSEELIGILRISGSEKYTANYDDEVAPFTQGDTDAEVRSTARLYGPGRSSRDLCAKRRGY